MSVEKTSLPTPAAAGDARGAAASAVAGAVPAPVPAPAPAAAGSVPLFGGHRGGGKKRADGLPAGSPEALEADRKKDRERKTRAAEAKRSAALPAPLPPAAAAGAALPDPAAAVAGGGVPVPPAAAGVVLSVPWTSKLLEKPARLLTRILDRVRKTSLYKRLDKACLPPIVADEIKREAEWKDAAVNDFSASLAECAAIELNKRTVSSANAHWVNLAMSGGELALAHVALCERIDKLVLAMQAEAKGRSQEPGDRSQEPAKAA